MTAFTIVTILPEIIDAALGAGVIGRARASGALDVAAVNPRDFTTDKHRSVDDTPYGGGPGMVMRPGPLLAAIDHATKRLDGPAHRVLLSPGGAPLTQARVRELAQLPHLVLVCGRYEGIDDRVAALAIDEELSLGDFVLTGGELAAAAVVDAVARLQPGVLGEPASADDESFSGALLEYPQYTRPVEQGGLAVPEILLGGNHEAIRKWRRTESLRRTAQRRPDLLAQHRFTKEDEKLARGVIELEVASRMSIALCHYPVTDRTGAVVTTAVTNLDLHDLARSSATYGLASCYIVTPVEAQREKCAAIAEAWRDEGKDYRLDALARVRPVATIADAIADLGDPLVMATTAQADRFPAAERRSSDEMMRELRATTRPALILFGTGWGLVDHMIPEVSRVLAPIQSRGTWNHLSVRSAVAVILDRLLGLRA